MVTNEPAPPQCDGMGSRPVVRGTFVVPASTPPAPNAPFYRGDGLPVPCKASNTARNPDAVCGMDGEGRNIGAGL